MDAPWVGLVALGILAACGIAIFIIAAIFYYNLWVMVREGAEYFRRENLKATARARREAAYRSQGDEIVSNEPSDQ